MKRLIIFIVIIFSLQSSHSQQTQKPQLYGKNWMAITGKTYGAEAGAQIFQKGGNAVDAACAMLASVCTIRVAPVSIFVTVMTAFGTAALL